MLLPNRARGGYTEILGFPAAVAYDGTGILTATDHCAPEYEESGTYVGGSILVVGGTMNSLRVGDFFSASVIRCSYGPITVGLYSDCLCP